MGFALRGEINDDALRNGCCTGSTTHPTNRMAPVCRSRMRKKSGQFTVTSTLGRGRAVTPATTAVAAAASVPESPTETNAL